MHQDIMRWSENQRKLWLFELTISFESLVADSQHHKQANNQDLVEAGRAAGYTTELITIEVGSWGMLSTSDLCELTSALNHSQKDTANLYSAVIHATLLGSFRISCYRNCKHDPGP